MLRVDPLVLRRRPPLSSADFATDLEALRFKAGLSLRSLARTSGIPRSTLSDALSGRRVPRLETVLAIVRACGADPQPWRQRWAELKRDRQTGTDPGHPRPPAAPVPAQLPRDVAGFASRDTELAWLDGRGVALVHGPPGVGKTALALHWAHSVVDRYPDGQIFIGLRGHHPTLEPMSPVEALGRLLGAFDVPWLPAGTGDLDEAASLWRSSMAGRRLLIVLDDASSAEQVRPLLPGAATCTTVVTSRHYLAELIVHDGADSIGLDILSPASSVALLRRVVGASRVEAEPQATATVAAACGHLPLALRLAGAVVAGAPDRRFADLAGQLSRGDRLSVLEGLARPSAVEAAFELSYRSLPAAARLLFPRLGLHPGTDLGLPVAAMLADLDEAHAEAVLHTLVEAHLVEPAWPDRYRLHDLLHDYAARLVIAADGEATRDQLRVRLFDWYLDRALAVSTRLDKRERLWLPDDRRSAWEPDDEQATAWLAAEHRNLVAVIECDAATGTGQYAWGLIDLVSGLLFRRGEVPGLLAATDAALAAAQRSGDPRAEGSIYLRRAWLLWRAGQKALAAQDFQRARTLLTAAGARRPAAAALRGLSTCAADAGRLHEARRCAEDALAIYRADGDRVGQASTLGNLSLITNRAGDFTGAEAHLRQSLALQRTAGSRGSLGLGLANFAHICLVRGEIGRAVACAQEAVAIAREIGDGLSETIGLVNGADAHDQAGAPEEAHKLAMAALTRATELGIPYVEAAALDMLATTAASLGRPDARDYRARALRRVRETDDPMTEADLLVGAARDAYRTAIDAPSPADHLFRVAQEAGRSAMKAGQAADNRHVQAQALGLLAACDLGLGKVADALAGGRQAVEMHVASGARLAEATARCVLGHVMFRDADPTAHHEWSTARALLDELAVPDSAPLRRLLDATAVSTLPLFA
jgi:tetratricopeptide (TPR) repeat protein/transcriptional regulator with XRE-family HTH domain